MLKHNKQNPLLTLKLLITEFWDIFNGFKNDDGGCDPEIKLNLLKVFSEEKVRYKNGQPFGIKRDKFNKVKKKRHSLKSHKVCFVCGDKAKIRHHIISLVNGGCNSKRNIVSLCNWCHEEIHPWLKVN